VSDAKVYDASAFMFDHPVGPTPMLRGAGRDNTQDMEMHSGGGAEGVGTAEDRSLGSVPSERVRVFQPAEKGTYVRRSVTRMDR
jgi:cytochrome b involved in lipid metabolism